MFIFRAIMLPAAIYIQKAFRRMKKQDVDQQKVYNIGYGTLEEKCSLC